MRAREDWLERELDILELQKHVALFPLRERPRALLMHALYREGRQAEALDEYHQARALLNDQLGLEPGPELRKVHAQILKGDLHLERRPQQLPPSLPDFTGRTAEIALALRTLPKTVGITGMRGSGKTALANQVAHTVKRHYPDGQIFVRSNEVANELLRAVGVENPNGDKAALWREKARGRRFLIVVDDVQDPAQVAVGSVYNASKAAMDALTRSWAVEFGPAGVRVNSVAPGPIATDAALTGAGELFETITDLTTWKRVGQPEEIAEAVLFLASEKSSYVTGSVITADGGFVAS